MLSHRIKFCRVLMFAMFLSRIHVGSCFALAGKNIDAAVAFAVEKDADAASTFGNFIQHLDAL